MAKALYGFHGGPDPRMTAELATLRARVRELEAELARTRAAQDAALAADPLEESLDLLLTSPDAALV